MTYNYEIRELEILPEWEFLNNSEDEDIKRALENEDIDYFIDNDLLSYTVNESFKLSNLELNTNNLFDIDIIQVLIDRNILLDKDNINIYEDWSSHSDGTYLYLANKRNMPFLWIRLDN